MEFEDELRQNVDKHSIESLWKLAVSLQTEIQLLKAEKKEMQNKQNTNPNNGNDFKIVKFDVGGSKFTTTLTTLRKDPNSMLIILFFIMDPLFLNE